MFIDKVNIQRGAGAYKITMTLETDEMSARNSLDIIFIIFRRVYFDAFFHVLASSAKIAEIRKVDFKSQSCIYIFH